MSIYLIRHGKTRANEQRRYCGSTDLPLSEGGRAELDALSYRLPEGLRFPGSGRWTSGILKWAPMRN